MSSIYVSFKSLTFTVFLLLCLAQTEAKSSKRAGVSLPRKTIVDFAAFKQEYSKNRIPLSHPMLQQDVYNWYDLWNQFFTDTVIYDYVGDIDTGLKLSSFFDYSTECFDYNIAIMDQVYNFHDRLSTGMEATVLNMTVEIIFFWTNVASTDFKDAIINCFWFGEDVGEVVQQRINGFEDMTDFWLSLLFNVLGKSLTLYTVIDNIGVYGGSDPDIEVSYPDMVGEIAKMIRLVLDFESSTSGSMAAATAAAGGYYQQKRNDNYFSTPNLKASYETTEDKELDDWWSMNAIFSKVKSTLMPCKTRTQRLRQDEVVTEEGGIFSFTYVWDLADIFNIPLGFIDGAMGALPSDSNAYYCNKNLTAARDTADNMLEYFS